MRLTLCLLVALATISACARTPGPEGEASVLRTRLGAQAPLQWKLPKGLQEISALALDDEQRLFAMDDERALIYELNYASGRLQRTFAVGDPVLRGDFEGLSAVGDTLYALTSDGMLLRFPVGEDGETVLAEQRPTKLGKACEFEGLAYDPSDHALLLACKRVLEPGRKREVRLYRWPLSAGDDAPTLLAIDEDILAAAVGSEDFQPSAVAIDEADGSLWVLAARQRAVARLRVSAAGELSLLEAIALPFAAFHRQSEGLALTAEQEIIIADEGGKKKGRLARYGKR